MEAGLFLVGVVVGGVALIQVVFRWWANVMRRAIDNTCTALAAKGFTVANGLHMRERGKLDVSCARVVQAPRKP